MGSDRQHQLGSSALRCGVLTSTHPSMLPALCFWFFGFAVVGAFGFFVCLFFLDYSPGVTPTTPHTLTHPFPLDTPPPPSAPYYCEAC